MSHAAKPPSPPLSLGPLEELHRVWETYRRGSVYRCPKDGSGVALTVDEAGGLYRFVCAHCGASSAWFESSAAGIVVRQSSPSGSP